ncbi:MAG: NAD(P)/FAD-dependent oxidoreductase [Fibrobacteria bacterium]|nr:NAD(P)/FAD-dependent oxidoreductase [Fibrobacteria bacterium]
MSKSRFYDVIVLGGGPAGLGCAMQMAEHGISTLVLEKDAIGTTKKTWLSFDESLKKYGLESCACNRFSNIVFSSYLGGKYSFTNTNFLRPLDENKALCCLADKAGHNGADIHGKERFASYAVENASETIVTTNKRKYRTRLVVDAMGRESTILQSLGLSHAPLDMGCLAYRLDNVKHTEDNTLLLYDSFYPGSDYFWMVPLSGESVMVGVFFFSSLTDTNMEEKSRKLKQYIRDKKLGGKKTDTRMGNIPLGNQVHCCAEPFLFFGDSSNTPLPSSGFSFHRCLEESEILGRFAVEYLDNNKQLKDFKKEILGPKIPGLEIHLLISEMLSKFTDPMLNKAVSAMNHLDEKFLISFLSGNDMSVTFSMKAVMAILNIFSMSEIRSLSLKQNYVKSLMNFYNLIPSVSPTKLGEQVKDFVLGIWNNRGEIG